MVVRHVSDSESLPGISCKRKKGSIDEDDDAFRCFHSNHLDMDASPNYIFRILVSNKSDVFESLFHNMIPVLI